MDIFEDDSVIEDVRRILEENGIFPKAGTSECVKKKTGSCSEKCKYFNECKFFVSINIDLISYTIAPERFPNGLSAYIINQIELFKMGIQPSFVDLNLEDYENDLE